MLIFERLKEMVNSINKGKTFEREIAKLLTEKTGKQWHRVPMSGAFQTNNQTNASEFRGDVFCEEEGWNNIVVECKFYKKFNVQDIFNNLSDFHSWITQSEFESKGKPWTLFIKINHVGRFIVFLRPMTQIAEQWPEYPQMLAKVLEGVNPKDVLILKRLYGFVMLP
jgi:Holliday junction resolvase